MALIFDHLGVAVQDIESGRKHLEAVFAVRRWTHTFADAVNGVYVQFGYGPGDMCYELVAPLGPESPILRALKMRNPILNHVAYLTESLSEGAAHLREAGYMTAGAAKPAIAYEGRLIQFFVSPLGFIVELIEAIEHRHEYI